MEPLLIREGHAERRRLLDKVVDLVDRSARLHSGLPPGMREPLAAFVRSMNCYYSNLIEGHDTHPIDIDRALRDDFSHDPRRRELQREARAHIEVQAWIDTGGLTAPALAAASIREIHARFYRALPDELRVVRNPQTGEAVPVVPGQWRTRHVQVGRLEAISPGAVPRFLDRFEAVYANLGRAEAVLSAAAAHHRLLWIHPFLDGNGRVARLATHGVLLTRLETGALWSPARGLARRVADYRSHLAACDAPRRNDLDGRGALSEEALLQFTDFFLDVCIDQVAFMGRLMEPDRLQHRVLTWAAEDVAVGRLSERALPLLQAVLHRGELPRAQVAAVAGVGERQGRRLVAELIRHRVLTSAHLRDPLRLGFPIALADRWMPGLFPA